MGARAPVRGIAIDLFHTLVDPEDFRPKEFLRPREIAKLVGADPVDLEKFWSSSARERMVTQSPTVLDRVREFCSSRGITPPERVWPQVSDVLGRYADLAIRNPRKGILSALRRFKDEGWLLGLVSNCDEREIRAWADSPLVTLFDATVFSCEVGAAKPDEGAYRALIPRWGGVPLTEAVFVGDGSNDELAGAHRAGFLRVVFDDEFVASNGLRDSAANERLRKQADATIHRLEDLTTVLLP